MDTGDSLRQIASLVDALEDQGLGVENVSLADDTDQPLVDLTVRLPDGETTVEQVAERIGGPDGTPAPEAGIESPAVEDELGTGTKTAAAVAGGPVGVDADTPSEDGPGKNESSSDSEGTTEGTAASDGAVVCHVDGCDQTFDSDHGMKIHAAKSHGTGADGGDQPHRDPDRLSAVYENHETFDEMQAALETDVTAQTVRRNMMKFGIHEPDSSGSAGHVASAASADPDVVESDTDDSDAGAAEDGSAAAEPPEDGQPADGATDGASTPAEAETGETTDDSDPLEDPCAGEGPADIEALGDLAAAAPEALPGDVDLAALATAVCESRTLYEFQEHLDVDRPTAQELLAEFDLLDLVTGRVGTRPVDETPTDEVVDRIADAVSPEANDGSGAAGD